MRKLILAQACPCTDYGDDSKIVQQHPEVIKLVSYSTQLRTKIIMLLKVKMLTNVGILTFISTINTRSERLKFFICRYFSVYEQLKFCAQLS